MSSTATFKALLVKSRSRLVALPMASVVETMRPLPITPLPGLARVVRGLSVIRGLPVPMLDLGMWLDGEESQATRVVTFRAGERIAGLLVDEVLGVEDLEAQALHALPFDGEGALEAVGAVDSQILVVFQAARAVPDAAWEALSR
ncbi:CheW-like domain protein [compost metagenome]